MMYYIIHYQDNNVLIKLSIITSIISQLISITIIKKKIDLQNELSR